MRTKEETTSREFERTITLEKALIKLENADMLLSHWVAVYGFSRKPDPKLIFDNTEGDEELDRLKMQAFTWFVEYWKIYQFVDMALDYIQDSRDILEQVIHGNDLTGGPESDVN
jgi:hypothetical protein